MRHDARVGPPLRDAVVLDAADPPSVADAIPKEFPPSAEELQFAPPVADDLLPVEQVLPEQEQAVLLLHEELAALVRSPRAPYAVCVVARGHELVLSPVVPSAVAVVLPTSSSAPLSFVVP